MYERRRNLVRRGDGKLVNVARFRGQLFVCANNCCCGRTEDGFAAVPANLYHQEWERRRLRNLVHLTIGGCLGPCALANVAMLQFESRAFWFHSMNGERPVLALFDFIERLLNEQGTGAGTAPPAELAALQFSASTSEPRPDGLPVEDYRPRLRIGATEGQKSCDVEPMEAAGSEQGAIAADAAYMDGDAAAPRQNGELVFEAPWQGRAFGMAVALHEERVYPWDDFRERLVEQIAGAESQGEEPAYYERWLAALEVLLEAKGIVTRAEVEERAYQFEFGERDDVY